MSHDCKHECDVGAPVVPFAALHATPVIPKMYWDVYSAEERWKHICCTLDKLIDYVNKTSATVNTDSERIADVEELIEDIAEGRYVDGYIDQLAAYIDDNLQAFVSRLAAYVFPGLYWDGETWRFMLTIPQDWAFLRFKWVWVPEDGTYHITLNY